MDSSQRLSEAQQDLSPSQGYKDLTDREKRFALEFVLSSYVVMLNSAIFNLCQLTGAKRSDLIEHFANEVEKAEAKLSGQKREELIEAVMGTYKRRDN